LSPFSRGGIVKMGEIAIVIKNKILYHNFNLDNEIVTTQDIQDLRIYRMLYEEFWFGC
jgi:hypothetical protein